MFSMTARAKYDAHSAQSEKYVRLGGEAARARYVEIARGVGWDGKIDEEEGEEGLSDLSGDDEPGPSSRGSEKGKAKAGGMGTSVSVMVEPTADPER